MKVRHRDGGDGGREGTVGRGVGGRVWFGLLGFNALSNSQGHIKGGREGGRGRAEGNLTWGGGGIDRMY